ncbi:hypothetical protein EDC96DRAFT_529377 [Choanephora cucurbitarum]|nr:hypothetical protein EDC96DRAFT_529377 [Choanephora cucurbitarum]
MPLRRALNPQVTKKYICKLTATDITQRLSSFFESCNEVDGEIYFERFIKSHHSSADDYASWCRDFKKSASACGVKVLNANTAKFFGEKTLKAQKKKIREERFGNYRRMPTSLRDEIQSVLDDFHDDDDLEKLEDSLRNMKKNATNPVAARVLKVLISLLDHMIEEEAPYEEMRLQSGVLPALCQAFKLSRKHDAYGCNKVLFPSFDALKQCRPDFVVRVQGQNDLFNVAVEIKEEKAKQRKNSLVIQVVGADVTFFLCFLLSGVCVMMEVDTITLPIYIQKYGDIMSHLNAMYNISLLVREALFDAVKLMYDIHSTTKTSTVCNQSNIFSSTNASTAL